MAYEKIAAGALKLLKSAIQKDAANRYSLLVDWTFIVNRDLPPFENSLFEIKPFGFTDSGMAWLTVKAYTSTAENNICDGASMAPDTPKGVVEGTLFHDPWYLSIDEIAAAWGWKRGDVRKLGDDIFAALIVANDGSKKTARLYYNGVRYGGGGILSKLWHALKRLLAVLAISLAVGGCNGCLAPPEDLLDMDNYTPPKWEKAEDVPAIFIGKPDTNIVLATGRNGDI